MRTVCFHGHVQGASHEASGKVCQDYSGTREVRGERGDAYIAVVADGHGDPVCRRSDRGSALAVRVALDTMEALARTYLNTYEVTWQELRRLLLDAEDTDGYKRKIATRIVFDWCAAVYDDYRADPIEDFAQAMEDADEDWRKKVMRKLYGTTLVCAMLLPDLSVFVQQGDGCAAAIFCDDRDPLAKGDVIPEDALCVGNVTTSLSDTDAVDRVRVLALDGESNRMAALFVGTDGVDKSLPREGAPNLFSGIALDVVARNNGGTIDIDTLECDLEDALRRVSRTGSGDDASIAGIVDLDLTASISVRLQAERSRFDLRAELDADKARLSSMSRKYEYYRTLDPPNNIVAGERDKYLAEYRRLEEKVRVAEDGLVQSAAEEGASVGGAPEVEEQSLEASDTSDDVAPSANVHEKIDEGAASYSPMADRRPSRSRASEDDTAEIQTAFVDASDGSEFYGAHENGTFDEEAGYDDAIAFATTPRLPVQRRAERQKGQDQRARTTIKRRDLVLIAIVMALVVVLAVVAITFFGALNSNAELAETTNRAVDVPEQPVPQGMPSKSPPSVQVDADQPVAESPVVEGGLVRMQGDVGVGEQMANEQAPYVDGREVFPQGEAAESDAATPNGY